MQRSKIRRVGDPLGQVLQTLPTQVRPWVWELVRNAESRASPQTYRIGILTKASSKSLHISHWRSSALKHSKWDLLEGRFGVLVPQQCWVGSS